MSLVDGAAWEKEFGIEPWPQQPAPVKNDHPASWDLVLKDISGAKFASLEQAKVHLLLIEDIKKRDVTGEKKYGVRLQPFNGRDSIQDAYEESLDLIVYLRSAMYENEKDNIVVTKDSQVFQIGLQQSYLGALEIALKLRYMIEKKSEERKPSNEQSIIDTSDGRGSKEPRQH